MGFANKIRSFMSGGHSGQDDRERDITEFIAKRAPRVAHLTDAELDAMTADAIERAGGREKIERDAQEFREQLKAEARAERVRNQEKP